MNPTHLCVLLLIVCTNALTCLRNPPPTDSCYSSNLVRLEVDATDTASWLNLSVPRATDTHLYIVVPTLGGTQQVWSYGNGNVTAAGNSTTKCHGVLNRTISCGILVGLFSMETNGFIIGDKPCLLSNFTVPGISEYDFGLTIGDDAIYLFDNSGSLLVDFELISCGLNFLNFSQKWLIFFSRNSKCCVHKFFRLF